MAPPSALQQAVCIVRYPQGMPRTDDFALSEIAMPAVAEGELLLQVIYLSIDPYLRALLGARYLSARPPVGAMVPGSGIGVVIESRDSRFAVGDHVVAECGWREFACVAAGSARKIDPAQAPISTALGVLGIPGLTAWSGLRTIGQPKPGETVLVSTAAGAVGSLACQLAERAAARVVGIAGSADKCALAVAEFGCTACVNYKEPDFEDQLRAACAGGIDVYFDNVGGRVLEIALSLLKPRARVILCGLIDQYNAAERPPGPNLGPVIGARATLTGLVVYDHLERYPQLIEEVAPLLRAGKIRWREDVRRGLGAAPQAFVDLMHGANSGKVLVRVSGDAIGGRPDW